jgi:Carboxypeptidase regulatory-like domain/TonB-dependent Receptor Plug Domain
MKQRALRSSVLRSLLALVSLSAIALGQQSSGSIRGTVKDSQGAVVFGAKVTLTDVAQGDNREVKTNQEGIFFFNPLKPSVYKVSIEATGFRKIERTEIRVSANDRLDLPDFTLAVGAMTESITVEASGVILQTRSAEKGGVLTGNQVINLALNGRSFLDLTRTVPGVVPNGGVGGSVNGNRNNQNNLMVDGVTNIDTGSNGGQLATMNIDQIAEFKMLTNSQPAEYGRSSGASISVVTKSGSRDLHGTGYIFHRHEGLNANNWRNNVEGRSRQLFRDNTAGFNIGGPAYIPKINANRDKLFFFIGIEWQNRLSPNSLRSVTVPTAAQRSGDFSRTTEGDGRPVFIRDPLSNLPCATNAGGGGCFPGNIIPASRISRDGQKILNFYPQPNVPIDPQFNYLTQVSDTFPRRENIYRGDYNINDKWRFYSRFIKTKSQQDRAYGQWNADYNIPFAPMNFGNPGWSWVNNLTTTINPTLTNEFIFGSSKNVLNIDPVDKSFDRAKLGLEYKMPFNGDTLGLVQNWRFGGVPNAPFTNFLGTPFRNFNNTFDITDNVTKVKGAHTMKFGIYLHKSRKDQTAFTSVNGDVWFDRNSQNPGDTNWAYSNALLGNFDRLAQSDKVLNGQYRSWNVEWFAQDNWRINKKLTLDYGIRFYWIQPQYDAGLNTSSFNPGLYDNSSRALLVLPDRVDGVNVGRNPVTGAIVPNALVGSIVNNGKGFVNGLYANGMGLSGSGSYPKGLLNNRGIHYAPRLGLAYQLDQKTVLRAGFGIFYDRFQGNPVFDMLPNPPSTIRPTYYFGNLAQVANLSGTFFPNNVRGFDQNGNVPSTYQWNLTVQRQLAQTVALEVGYVANTANHLLSTYNFNAMPFGSAWQRQNQNPQSANLAASSFDGRTALPVNLYRPYLGHGDAVVTTFGGFSNYNSLQVSVNKNAGKGLQYGVAYTWSKALGISSGDGDRLHPTNYRSANYSYLDFDVAQMAVINFIYDVPSLAKTFTPLNNAVGRNIFGGWQVSGLMSLIGGQPTNIGVSFSGIGGELNRVYTGSESVGPRVGVTANPILPIGDRTDLRYINTSVFAAPQIGSQGLESAQRIVRNPGVNNLDLSVFKNFPMGAEKRFLQLRLEMFNAPNHTQFNGFNNTAQFNPTSGAITNLPTALGGGGGRFGFGAVTGARDPRFIQLAAKFYF